MEKELIVRKASVADIPFIGSLARKVWPVTYGEILSAPQMEYMLELFYSDASLQEQMTKHSFLIAAIGGFPLGFASFSISAEPAIYKLHKLYVDVMIQGKGLGKTLINHIVDELRSLDASALDLNVNRNNKARLFYEKLGFKVIREEDIDIGESYWMNDYVMRLLLEYFIFR